MKRNFCPLAILAALLSASAAHAGQPADAARFSIMAPVQAAYDAYQVEANRAQNTMDKIEAELRERSEEHTSELQSLMRISYAVFCLKKKQKNTHRKQYS